MSKIFDDRPQTAVRMGLHTFWLTLLNTCFGISVGSVHKYGMERLTWRIV